MPAPFLVEEKWNPPPRFFANETKVDFEKVEY